jgi:hypothetical protein
MQAGNSGDVSELVGLSAYSAHLVAPMRRRKFKLVAMQSRFLRRCAPRQWRARVRPRLPKLRVNSAKATDWYTARRVGELVYGYKTLVEEDTGRILGAHLVGPHADEVINLFGLAIRHNLTADDLKTTMFAYPTGASDISHML